MSDNGRRVSSQKSSERGKNDSEKASPAAIEKYLKGISFPAKKEDIVNKAKENSAPNNVINIISQFAEKQYHNVIEISKEVGRIE